MVPSSVTGIAVMIQPADLLPRRMARATLKLVVIFIQGPARRGVTEGRLALGIMTMATILLEMTIGAELVFLFFSLKRLFRMTHVVAVCTIFILMTICAQEPE